jgi:predicted Zn-dependent peptidase
MLYFIIFLSMNAHKRPETLVIHNNIVKKLATPTHTRVKTTLSNGVRVVTETMPLAQSFALGVWIDAGSGDEARNEHGMAHLLEHVVFRGTQKRSALHIANYLESVGGYVNAFTTKDHTCYYTRALTEHFERSLDLLADIVANPLLRQADLEKERGIILEEMKSLEDEPEELINDYLDASLFGSHALAHPISGSVRSLKQFDEQTLASFHACQYAAEHVIVAVAGNVQHDAVCRAAEKFLGHIQHSPARRRRAVPKRRAATHSSRTKPVQQAHYLAGVMMPQVNDEEYYTLAALNVILGDGMSSRLNQSIREKRGLCYNVYSAVNDMRDCAVFSIYAAMEERNLRKTQDLITRELRALAETPVTKAELSRAKEQLKSSLIIGLEGLSGRMNLLAKSELYGSEYEEIEERVAAIERISDAQILALMDKYLRLDEWHTSSILPEEE